MKSAPVKLASEMRRGGHRQLSQRHCPDRPQAADRRYSSVSSRARCAVSLPASSAVTFTSLHPPHTLAITHKTSLGLPSDRDASAALLPHAWPVAARATGHATAPRAQNSPYEPVTVICSAAGGSAYHCLRFSSISW